MTATFAPRTYGADVFTAWTTRSGFDCTDAARRSLISAIDDRYRADRFASKTNDEAVTLLRDYRETVLDFLTSEHLTFPGDTYDSLVEAVRAIPLPWDPEHFPSASALGNTHWTNSDLWNRSVAKSRDRALQMPDLGEHPVDSYLTFLNERVGGYQASYIGSNRMNKISVALMGMEKARVGWAGDEPVADPWGVGTLHRVTEERPSGAVLHVGDLVRVTALRSLDEPGGIRRLVVRVEDGDDDQTWYVSSEHLSESVPDEPELVPHEVMYAVGDTVRVLTDDAYDAAGVRVGDTANVIEVNPYSVRARMLDGATDGRTWWFRIEPRYGDIEKVEPEVVPEAGDSADLAMLNERITSLTAERTRLLTWQQQAVSDIETASRILIEEANRRSWCNEYDEIIDRCNSDMSVLSFENREEEHEVEVTWTATISGATTVMVTARSARAAREMVENDPEEYVEVDSSSLAEAARYNGADDIEFEVQ